MLTVRTNRANPAYACLQESLNDQTAPKIVCAHAIASDAVPGRDRDALYRTSRGGTQQVHLHGIEGRPIGVETRLFPLA